MKTIILSIIIILNSLLVFSQKDNDKNKKSDTKNYGKVDSSYIEFFCDTLYQPNNSDSLDFTPVIHVFYETNVEEDSTGAELLSGLLKSEDQAHNDTTGSGILMNALGNTSEVSTATATVTIMAVQSAPNPAEKTINTSLPVGAIEGSFDVSPMGSATYSLPIALPKGINGMEPRLAVVYNSSGGNNLLGSGWGLSGMSFISRAPSTIFQDGMVDGISLDPNEEQAYSDQYQIEGERLIYLKKTGSKRIYHTENESYNIIELENDKFTVYTPGGGKLVYGNSTNEKLITSEGKSVAWYLTEAYDIWGNKITYTYVKDAATNELLLNTISYAGVCNVSFTYDRCSTTEYFITAGMKIINSRMLSKITVTSDGTVFREYEFVYFENYTTTVDNGKYYLAKIKEKGFNGTYLNDTWVNWANFQTAPGLLLFPCNSPRGYYMRQYSIYDEGNPTFSSDPYRSLITGDLNGDGKTDIVSFRQPYYRDEGIPAFYITNTKSMDIEKSVAFSSAYSAYRCPMTGDINGDGKDEVIVFLGLPEDYNNVSSGEVWVPGGKNASRQLIIMQYSIDASGNESLSVVPSPAGIVNYGISTGTDNTYHALLGDFNGDGRVDIGFANATKVEIYTSNGNYSFGYKGTPNTVGAYNKIFTADLNGDGRDEILTHNISTKAIYSYFLDNLNNGNIVSQGYLVSNSISDPLKLNDVNLDGKTDIISGDSRYSYDFIYSGSNYTYKLCNTDFYYRGEYYDYADLSGDGKVERYNYAIGVNSSGKNRLLLQSSAGSDVILIDNKSKMHVFQAILGDFNGDGIPDHLVSYTFLDKCLEHCQDLVTYDKWRFLYDVQYGRTFSGNEPLLVSSIENGMRLKTVINYQPLTNAAVYTRNQVAAYPMEVVTMPMKVVSSYQVYDNSRGALKLLENVGYTYKNARVNKEGKGFLGFSQITITDNIGQQIINTYYNILSTLYVPVLYSTFTSVSGQGNIGSAQSSYNYYRFAEPLISTNKLYFIYPSLVYTYDYLNDQSNNVSNTFTASDFYHGNPSKERLTQYNNSTAYSGGTAGYVEASNQFEDYTLNGYTFKRLKSSSVISNRTGDASNARTDISLGYDAAKPPIMKNKTVSYFNYGGSATGGSVVYSYNRDNYGNISSQHVTGSGKTRYTAYIYTNGRFLNRVSNALGHAVLYTYNSKTCLLESTSDANSLTTLFTYDDFGRVKKVTAPDGTYTSTSMAWLTSGDALYAVVSANSDGTWVKAENDIAGRTLVSSKQAFATGYSICVKNEFNANSQLYRTSQPYFSNSSPAQWDAFYYDPYGRVDYINKFTGAMTDYTYNGKTVSVAENGQTYSNTSNPFGEMASATDPAGTIAYTYYADGKLKSTAVAGLTTTITYDLYGNRKTIVDPDAENVTFEYNALGDLLKQTDASGNITDMTATDAYDAIGRLKKKKVCNSGSTEVYDYIYSYDTQKKGLIDYISQHLNNALGHKESFAYDGYGRLVSKTEQIVTEGISQSFIHAYTYDTYGRLSSEKYPSGFEIVHTYMNGYHKDICKKSDNSMIWEAVNRNARDQVTSYKYGNNLGAAWTFNSYGLPSNHQVGTILNHGYSFNSATGLLNSRTDNLKNLTETFGYDTKLKTRLKSATLQDGTVLFNISYDDTKGPGQISSKLGNKNIATQYRYENTVHKNAVSSVVGSDISLPVQNINYTPFNKVKKLTQNSNLTAEFSYGIDNQRRAMKVTNGSNVYTRYYLGNFEKEVNGSGVTTRELNYITCELGIVAIYDSKAGSMYYVSSDYLGSIEMVTSQSGAKVEELSYDAWGRRRNATTWKYDNAPASFTFARGYTGHEHLDEFGLINMNGRVYDPTLGTFLSPDKYIQNPSYSPFFNRYTYCLNNPLIYTDPSGWQLYSDYNDYGGRHTYQHYYYMKDIIDGPNEFYFSGWSFNWHDGGAWLDPSLSSEEWNALTNPGSKYLEIYLSKPLQNPTKAFRDYIGNMYPNGYWEKSSTTINTWNGWTMYCVCKLTYTWNQYGNGVARLWEDDPTDNTEKTISNRGISIIDETTGDAAALIRKITFTLDHNNSIRFIYKAPKTINKINKIKDRTMYLAFINDLIQKSGFATLLVVGITEYGHYVNNSLNDIMTNYLDYCEKTNINPGMVVIETGVTSTMGTGGTIEFYINNDEKTHLGGYGF